jgi:predicted dehydrogenase
LVNVLVIGGGSIAKKHVEILNKLNFRVYSYTNNDNFYKNKNKIIRIKNFEKLPELLFVVIANSTNKHLKYLNLFIKKKINIYCEKPIYFKKFNYLKLRKLIKTNNIKFFCGYQLLRDSKVHYVKRKLRNLKINSFISTVGHDYNFWRKNKSSKNSYYNNVSSGGGVIFELIHEINLINYLVGDIDLIKSFKINSKNYNCDIIASSIIKTKKKIIGTLYQDMFSKKFFRQFKIITNKKNIEIDFVRNVVFDDNKIIKFKSKNTQIILIEKNLKHFIKQLKDNKISIKSFNDSVRDLKNCLEMHASSK